MNFLQKIDIKLYIYLLVLVYIPYNIYNYFLVSIRPDILLITIFYFSIIKRLRVNLIYIAFIGLLNDELLNMFLGSHALIYVVVSVLSHSDSNSLHNQKFSVVYASFMCVALIPLALSQVIDFILTTSQTINISYNDILSAIATILVYPFLHYFYTIKLHWFVLSDER